MATLKSFELKGNKLSFANFISNLSPCDTPFTSMIGKEAIDQTQYSWQTDSLAPANNTPIEEGSQAAVQARASTQVLTNFTSTLRTVASVSDTVKEMSTFGRNKEMQYQLGKAGKEILRDLEHMNLHNLNGLPGSKTVASTFAGFEGLVAGLAVTDPDTGAIVHKVAQISGTRFDKKDLFDITTNLYIAGSKADKIMFHPKFASAFSDLIADDADAGLTYRMFDGLGTKYNAQVKKVKDPLGKVWTLLPNRFMPEDKFYFFHESDWSQMVLRSPKTTKLAKKGSSEQFMVEMEVGLRHKHPFVSGILAFTTVLVQNRFTPAKSAFTASIADGSACRSDVTVDGVAEAGLEVHFHTSDPDVATFENLTVTTAASGRASNRIVIGRKDGIVGLWTVCKGIKSNIETVVVGLPLVDVAVDKLVAEKNETIAIQAIVQRADGTPIAKEGFPIKWYVNPSSHLELDSITSSTDASGVAKVNAKVLKKDTTLIQGLFDNNASNPVHVNYTPKPAGIVDFTLTPNTIDIGGFSNMSAKVVDDMGNPIQGVLLNWISNNSSVGQPNQVSTRTDDQGVAISAIKGVSRGSSTAFVVVHNDNIESNAIPFFVGQGATLDLEVNPNPGIHGEVTTFHGSIKGQDGVGIQDVEFNITSDMEPTWRFDDTTDDDGEFSTTHTFASNSDHEIIFTAPSLGIEKRVKLVLEDRLGIGELKAAEILTQPIQVGGKSIARVVLVDGSGLPLKDAEVKWTVSPSNVVVPNNTVTRTDLNGMTVIELTGVGKGTGVVTYECSRKFSERAIFQVGQGVDLVITHSPEKPLSNQEVTFTASVKRSDNNAPVPNAEVVLTCSPDASYFPATSLTTNAQGLVEYKTIFITEDDFVIAANAPSLNITATTTVDVQPINGAGDIKYVHSVSGHTVPHTHSISRDLPVTLYTTQHGGLPALNMKMECLDLNPDIATSIVPNITTNTEGKIVFHVRGIKSGVARFRVRAIGAIANFLDFEVTVVSPKLNVTINPQTVGGGKRIEFSADLKDYDNNWVPGAKIRWEYPHNMLAHGQGLEEKVTDQYGYVYYDRVAALWGNHVVRAVLVDNPLIRSRDFNINIHM